MAGDEDRVILFHQIPQHPFSVSFFKPLRNAPRRGEKEDRLPVQKTYKLFIGGKFVRERKRPGRAGGKRRPGAGQLRTRFAQGFPRRGRSGARRRRGLVEAKRLSARTDSLPRGGDARDAASGVGSGTHAHDRKEKRQGHGRSQPNDRAAGPLRGLDGQVQPDFQLGESGRQLALQFHHARADRRGGGDLP